MICPQANEKLLYEAHDFPVFQNRMYDSSEQAIACQKGDIMLVENRDTGLVYNTAFLPELMNYDSAYQNEQALSPRFEQHLLTTAGIIETEMGKENLVEIGCGKGFFLDLLQQQGFDLHGFDPAYEGDNPAISKHNFEPGAGASASGFILRHVLEHIQDPVGFLMKLRDANQGTGLIYIEVPCFDWICRKKAWFDVFYEHVNYFRKSDFLRVFGQPLAIGTAFGGQYIYVVADLAQLTQPLIDHHDRVSFPANFRPGRSPNREPENAAIWGGASKGVIFSLLKSRIGQRLEMIIDINPAKQGKYIAATGLRVLSPQEGLTRLPVGATIYVMNSNYLEEIINMSNNAYHYVTVDT